MAGDGVHRNRKVRAMSSKLSHMGKIPVICCTLQVRACVCSIKLATPEIHAMHLSTTNTPQLHTRVFRSSALGTIFDFQSLQRELCFYSGGDGGVVWYAVYCELR